MAQKDGESEKKEPLLPLHTSTTRLIMEAGMKLYLNEEAIATAATFYHIFCSTMTQEDYEKDLVAMATLSLASKALEHNTKLGDVVNTCHRCLHKSEPPLEVSDTYWQLKDSVAKYELLLLRALNFRVYLDLPHKYLLHHLLALSRWIDERVWYRSHVTQVAWALLQDSYHTTLCLSRSPNLLATAVLYLALHCCKLDCPGASTAQKQWWAVICPGCEEKELQDIAKDIMAVHDEAGKMEKKVVRDSVAIDGREHAAASDGGGGGVTKSLKTVEDNNSKTAHR